MAEIYINLDPNWKCIWSLYGVRARADFKEADWSGEIVSGFFFFVLFLFFIIASFFAVRKNGIRRRRLTASSLSAPGYPLARRQREIIIRWKFRIQEAGPGELCCVMLREGAQQQYYLPTSIGAFHEAFSLPEDISHSWFYFVDCHL
jgi:hypothetical protein